MLVETPQITWHGGSSGKNDPVLSLDFHQLRLAMPGPATEEDMPAYILVTAGADADVRLWVVHRPPDGVSDEGAPPPSAQRFVASFTGHQRSVNVVRFSPDGCSLASASDGGDVIVWTVDRPEAWSKVTSDRDARKSVLAGCREDVYDLTWSADSKYLACGAVDNTVRVWEVAVKKVVAALEDHTNYVQGIAWDPLGKYFATQSSDRSCRVYQKGSAAAKGGDAAAGSSITTKCSNVIKSHAVRRAEEAATCIEGKGSAVQEQARGGGAATGPDDAAGEEPEGKAGLEEKGNEGESGRARDRSSPKMNLFVDETVSSFFRRLAWTPDGAFLITPTAQCRDETNSKTQFCTYMFLRGKFTSPAACLPGLDKPSVAVRCCPVLFELKDKQGGGHAEGSSALTDLPYRMVFAVVTLDSVLVYDTEHTYPLTMATGLHCTGLTDASWSPDGLTLLVSSTDGYVSKVHFTEGEVGVPIDTSAVPVQTKLLYPGIYGSTTSMADAEGIDTPGEGPKGTASPASSKLEEGDEPEGTEGAATAPASVPTEPQPPSVKVKKKIAPTLLHGLPAAQPAAPATLPVPSEATSASGEKRKRITPELVPKVPLTVASSSPNTPCPSDTLSPPASKKRVAPTLVSAL